jgi:hypothetical protein
MSHAQNQQPSSQDQQASAQEQQPAAPAPSLGEIARQLKLKKQQKEARLQQAKATQPITATQSGDAGTEAKPVQTAHIVTNDESPDRPDVRTVEHPAASETSDSQPSHDDRNGKAEKWKSDILAQRNEIASMEKEMKAISDSIHYAGGNCIANCAQWNEKQQEKQQEVESMKGQLEQLQKQLQEMQESARKEGFGSSVYDPSE